MRRVAIVTVLLMTIGLILGISTMAPEGQRGHRLKITFSGIVLLEDTDRLVTAYFPDGSTLPKPHTHNAFIRFRTDELEGSTPPQTNQCDDKIHSWFHLKPGDRVKLKGVEPEPLDHSFTFWEGLPVISAGVTRTLDICDIATIDKRPPHAELELTAGKFSIGRRTKHQWEFRPGPHEIEPTGIKWRLVNLVELKARLEGETLTVEGVDGRDLDFIPNGKTLEIAFGNAPKECLSRAKGELQKTPTPDDHFKLYYDLIRHEPHKERHLPWGRKLVAAGGLPTVPSEDDSEGPRTEEGGGCPPLIKRP